MLQDLNPQDPLKIKRDLSRHYETFRGVIFLKIIGGYLNEKGNNLYYCYLYYIYSFNQ